MPRKRRGGEKHDDSIEVEPRTNTRSTRSWTVLSKGTVSQAITKSFKETKEKNIKEKKRVDGKGEMVKKSRKAEKRKVAQLAPACSPSLSPLTKSQKIAQGQSPNRMSTTSKIASPHFSKTRDNESQLKNSPSRMLTPKKGSCSTPISGSFPKSFSFSLIRSKTEQGVSLSESLSPMIPDATKEERIEMMKKYMGDRVGSDASETSSEVESDWEEVAEMPHFTEPSPEKKELTVQVVLEAPDPLGYNKKKMKRNSAEELFARQWNKFMRELRIDMHKAHLLCLIAYGLRRNAMCSDPILKGHALSTVPPQYLDMSIANKNQTGVGRVFVTKILRWFVNEYTVDAGVSEEVITNSVLQKRFETRQVASRTELLYMVVLVFRVLLVECRLCINLKPMTKKLPGKTTTKTALRQSKKTDERKKKNKSSESEKKMSATPKNAVRRKKASKVSECVDSSDEEGERQKKSKTKAKSRKTDSIEISSGESDFVASPSPSKCAKKSSSKDIKKRTIKSSDSDDSVIITKAKVWEKGLDEWLEVYIEREKQWFTVDCSLPKFDCKNRIEMQATKPIIYVLGFDSRNHVKDLTPRYNSRFSTEARKLRVEDDWWEATLLAYSAPVTEKTSLESAQLHAEVLKRPLPAKLDEYKNHPLYALERHLKKFEALYPRTAVPIGYAKNKEPIYARECVKELHSRNSWLKEARLVRVDETPYKIVKARKNFRKPTLPGQDDNLDLFGVWQTEEYMPPVAFRGKVPKNEYGNVDMYKPSMLPIGCVHLRLPGLNKVAKKLGKDVGPAMTGWDVHGGWSHPLLDGFIVCEEDQDVLITAWDDEQEEMKAKERAKCEQTIWMNWKLLIKGVLIRERLKKRFDLTEKGESSKSEGKNAIENQLSFPACRDGSSEYTRQTDSNLFPFEQI